MKAEWIVEEADPLRSREFADHFKCGLRFASLLVKRCGENFIAADRFINPRLSLLYNPFLMKNMKEAVERIILAARENEKIGVFADSDIDGLSSYTVLWMLLEKIDCPRPYLRFTRDDEDYGLSADIIEEFSEKGVQLLITLDSGIRDIAEIHKAREAGMDVIVVDHHEPGGELPEAIIVNPKQHDCSYPFKELAGVGVTFKLCQAIQYYMSNRYNQRYVIIVGENGLFHVSVIRNRSVEDEYEFSSVSHLESFVAGLSETDMVFPDEGVMGLFRSSPAKVFGLYDILLSFSGKNGSRRSEDINGIARSFGLDTAVYPRSIDLAVDLFLEYEYAVTPRLVDFIQSILDLVALGTIADIMPLKDENRIIVSKGLAAMKSTDHRGLKTLLNGNLPEPSSRVVAWNIAPLLNTPGRFGKTELTARFFLSRNEHSLNEVLEQIKRLNNERKKGIKELYEIFYRDLSGDSTVKERSVIFVSDKRIPEGLCGLLANRLTDAFCKPVIVISLDENRDVVKGSGRSIGNINFFSVVEPHASLFEKLGGHAQAFGFSARVDRLEEIRKTITRNLEVLGDVQEPKMYIDLDISPDEISNRFIDSLSLLEPYGCRNEEPVFVSRDIEISDFQRFGVERRHGKFIIDSSVRLEAIGWGIADEMERFSKNGRADLVYRLERNVYNGMARPRMIIIDMD